MISNVIYLNNKFEVAIKKLNILKEKILVVLNERKNVIGTITDGDIRRFFLTSKKKNIKNLMNSSPLVITESFLNKLSKKQKQKYRFAPLIDKKKKFIKLVNLYNYFNINSVIIFIFAGGKGLRLKPLTNNIPKPLIKIKNKTIIETIINSLYKEGFCEFYISVNYQQNKIIKYLNSKITNNLRINFIKENKYLGTAGSLSLLKNNKKIILAINSDIITNLNFKNLISHHLQNNSDLSICIKEKDNRIPYGVININNNKIISLNEKPLEKHYFNAGIYVLKDKIVKLIPKYKKIDMPELIMKAIKNKYNVSPFYMYENWTDIGSKETLIKLDKSYKKYFKK
jgi:dTDP-glucose pyrophosphorylase